MDADFPLDAEALAAAIDIPLEIWPGNCHAIAMAVRDLVPVMGMRLARGHWLGEVAMSSVYRRAPIQHSWLITADNRVLDPTRWAILTPERPSIYLGVCDDYDEGGIVLRSRSAFPTLDCHHTDIVASLSDDDRRLLAEALGASSSNFSGLGLSFKHAITDDPDRVPNAESIYRAVAEIGRQAMIPLDSWIRVMAPENLYCREGANRHFTLPPRAEMTDVGKMFAILNQFLTIEARPDIEGELEEIGYSLQDDLWENLNRMETMVAEEDFRFLPSEMCNTLGVIAGELLGRGFGEELRVERFAASIGMPLDGLRDLMEAFGERSGYCLSWHVPEQNKQSKALQL